MDKRTGAGATAHEAVLHEFGAHTESTWSRMVLGPARPAHRPYLRLAMLVAGWLGLAIAVVYDLGVALATTATTYVVIMVFARSVARSVRAGTMGAIPTTPFDDDPSAILRSLEREREPVNA